MTSQKGTIRAGLLIAVVVIVGALIYLVVARPGTNPAPSPQPGPTPTPTSPDETAGWKTYNNSTQGFEFIYPADLVLSEVNSQFLDDVLFWIVLDKTKFVFRETEIFVPIDLQIRSADPKDFGIENGIKSSIEIDNIRGTKIEYTDSISGNSSVVVIVKQGGKFWVFRTMDRDNYSTIFELLLPTFKFTSPDETAGWKTYSNSKLGFELKYPAELKVTEQFQENFWKQTSQHFLTVEFEAPGFNGVITVNNPGIGGPSLINRTESKITVAGIGANLLEGTADPAMFGSGDKSRYSIIQFEKGKDSYYLQFRYIEAGGKETVEKILSTFQFTK